MAKLLKPKFLTKRFWVRTNKQPKRSEIAEEARRRGRSCMSNRARAPFKM